MIVNLTFLVQIINFLFGYLFVKKLLFKPLLLKIENENLENEQGQNKIKKLNELILINKNELADNWQKFYQSKKAINFQKIKPVLFQQTKNKDLNIARDLKLEDKIIDLLVGELDGK